MDTHTAVAWDVAERTALANKTVVLSTASPYKFCACVLSALGEETRMEEFAQMERLNALTGVAIPAGLAGLSNLPVLHKDVIGLDEMESYVLSAGR